MSTLSQFSGGERTPANLVGANGTVGTGGGFSTAALELGNVRRTLSGALTANTYKDLVSVSGAGVLKFLVSETQDATARTMHIKVTLDGVQVVERSLAAAVSGTGTLAVGSFASNTPVGPIFDALPFKTSMVIAMKSTLGETDKVAAIYNYHTM